MSIDQGRTPAPGGAETIQQLETELTNARVAVSDMVSCGMQEKLWEWCQKQQRLIEAAKAVGAAAALERIQQLSGRWRKEAAEEQRVSFCADELDAALGAVSRSLQGWQPLSSAPKDGTPILAYRRGGDMVVARFDVGRWILDAGWPMRPDVPLTHWMTLPSPPGSGEAEP